MWVRDCADAVFFSAIYAKCRQPGEVMAAEGLASKSIFTFDQQLIIYNNNAHKIYNECEVMAAVGLADDNNNIL